MHQVMLKTFTDIIAPIENKAIIKPPQRQLAVRDVFSSKWLFPKDEIVMWF